VASVVEEFTAFANARAHRLRDTAYLLCGDWHLAEDLTQATLVKLYLGWRRVERAQNIDAYARAVMLRVFLDNRRLKRSADKPMAELPEPTVVGSAEPETRLTLMGALRRVSPNRRAVLVLRYWEDLSVETVAAAMSMTPGAVKALTVRALAELREVLGTDLASFRPGGAFADLPSTSATGAGRS
jgi:RNA polymerase sigma-70 factor (sigma-E family)